MKTLMCLVALGVMALAQTGLAECLRTDQGNGLYSLSGASDVYGSGEGEAVCQCELNDEIVTGGCYLGLPPNVFGAVPPARLDANIPNVRNGRWIWVCGARLERDPNHLQSYLRINVRAICRQAS